MNVITTRIIDGRHFNRGVGTKGQNGYMSRSAMAMLLIDKEGMTFSQLKSKKQKRNYWRAVEYLRGNTDNLVLIP